MSRSFINLNHTILILLSLLLTSCERKVELKVEPHDFYELKIDGEKQKLNEDETLKLKKYSRSICKISDFLIVNMSSTSTSTSTSSTLSTSTELSDLEEKPLDGRVATAHSRLEFNKNEFKLEMKELLLEGINTKAITIEDIKALKNIFLFFEKKKSGWMNVNFYTSDRGGENENIFEYFTMHFERSNVVCNKKIVMKYKKTSGE
jgi:hypothetical protein